MSLSPHSIAWGDLSSCPIEADEIEISSSARIAHGSGFFGKFKAVRIGEDVEVFPGAWFFGKGGSLELGDRVRIYNNNFISVGRGSISVGADAHFAPGCALYGHGGLEIGEWSALSANVVVSTLNHDWKSGGDSPFVSRPLVLAPIKIGRNVWIGANAVVTLGTEIDPDAVVGAGAVARGRLKGGGLFVGIPARPHPGRDSGGEASSGPNGGASTRGKA